MPTHSWQKSSYCAQGEACVHVSSHEGKVHLIESADLTGAILTAQPAAFAALIRTAKETPHA